MNIVDRRVSWRTAILLLLVGATFFVTLSALAAPAQGATFTVNNTADAPDANPGDGLCGLSLRGCTLRAAVMETNALAALGTSTSNTIWVLPGTYTLTIAGKGEDGAATGDLDVNGGSLSVIALFAVVFDGNRADRIFDVGPLVPTQFSLFGGTLQNGVAESSPPNASSSGPDVGGGIRVLRNSRLSVTSALFRLNHAFSRGGGIGSPTQAGTPAGADPTIGTQVTDTIFEDNTGGIEAAGFFNNRVAALQRVIVRNNRLLGSGLPGPPLERGAGIANSGALTLDDVVLSGNSMPSGSGGGIALRGDPIANVFGSLQATNVTISGNAAPQGGGVAIGNGATANMTNVTISGNQAGSAGGLANAGFTTLTNVSVVGNIAPLGGGIVTVGPPLGAAAARTTLRSTLLRHGPVGTNCLPPVPPLPFARLPVSAGDNISSDLSCNLTGPGDRNGLDPLVGPLANNGGFTMTHALLPGSPAIDGVVNNPCPPPSTDQRGVARPQDGDSSGSARCDIGSFEASLQPSRRDFIG